MKLKRVFLYSFFVLAIVLSGLVFSSCGCTDYQALNNYNIEATLNVEAGTLTAKQTVEYFNETGKDLNDVKFFLPHNAFREGAKSQVVNVLNEEKAYYDGKSYGGIEIINVNFPFLVEGEDKNVLTVKANVKNGGSVKIVMNYKVLLPKINHRLGITENTVNLGHFYPSLFKYGGGWQVHTYSPFGDPFSMDTANYTVKLNIPEGYTLAASGERISGGDTDGTYKLNNARDFAAVVSNKFKMLETAAGGIKISYYYTENEYPAECLETAKKAIETFNDLFGKYPYSEFKVIEAGFAMGGMEFSGLVIISDNIKQKEDYFNVIIHETAHQWWFGAVGSDQINSPWQDEGLTEFSTYLFYKKNPEYGINFNELISAVNLSYKSFYDVYVKVLGKIDVTIIRSIFEYQTEPEYNFSAYSRASLMFNSLYEILGEKRFLDGLSRYYSDYKFKFAEPDDFISSFEKGSGRKVKPIFESWLGGKTQI